MLNTDSEKIIVGNSYCNPLSDSLSAQRKCSPQVIMSSLKAIIQVMPAHQTSGMSRCTISPESRSKLEMVIFIEFTFSYYFNFSIC